MSSITLINKHGAEQSYPTQVPDLWHLAMHLKKEGKHNASSAVLMTWHLCHDLVDAAMGNGEARIVTTREVASRPDFLDAVADHVETMRENGVVE